MTNAPLEILLVEDNEGDVELTQSILSEGTPACNVSVANDGVEALEFLRKNGPFGAAPTPQLILLDLNMPRMDGKRVLETVKSDTSLKAVPIVMLTSSQSPDDIRACYERHANAYIVKPFGGKEYAAALMQIIRFWSDLGRLPTS